MKNKKLTYFLGFIVLLVWGMIVYRIFDASSGSDDDNGPVAVAVQKKELYNDFALTKDTSHLLLNYRDPFGLVKFKDTTAEMPLKKILHQRTIPIAKPTVNWNFIQYSGYVRNTVSKKLIALVNINGKSETFSEGENKDQVKLIKNLRDSIKISFNGQIKFIPIKTISL